MGHVRCAACQWPIEVSVWNNPQGEHCKHCAQQLRAYVFPSITREHSGEEAAEAVKEDNEASCFYHPESRATIHCDECGRFLCPICVRHLHWPGASAFMDRAILHAVVCAEGKVTYGLSKIDGQTAQLATVQPIVPWP